MAENALLAILMALFAITPQSPQFLFLLLRRLASRNQSAAGQRSSQQRLMRWLGWWLSWQGTQRCPVPRQHLWRIIGVEI
jgi:hypothetical protein